MALTLASPKNTILIWQAETNAPGEHTLGQMCLARCVVRTMIGKSQVKLSVFVFSHNVSLMRVNIIS